VRKRTLIALAGVLVAPLLIVAPAAPVGAAAVNFSQPSNAESGQTCHQNASVLAGAVCTWVSVTAFQNGSHYVAPKTGTINKLRLVSCIGGSFPAPDRAYGIEPAGQGRPERPDHHVQG
jgi:hypothetical protein